MQIKSLVSAILLFLLMHQCSYTQSGKKALEKYVTAKDSVYHWVTEQVSETAAGTFYDVKLVSQTWQHINWMHRLIVYMPSHARYANTLVLVLKHIYNRNEGMAGLAVMSDSTQTPSALLYDMPNQPLFKGMQEDDLQAYTFSRYMQSGDESWPLLFPMVKSVVRAMDAINDLSAKEGKPAVTKFVVAGHSKRGHTAWLTAAVDERVKGIIPIAIDVLNAKEQLPHHLSTFRHYSTPSTQATAFLKRLKQPRGNDLIQLIDPYGYKRVLQIPAFIVCATNDEFFPTDALNLYWDELKGPKSVLYLSNAGHVRADSDPRINPAAFAFVRAIAMDTTLPSFIWRLEPSAKQIQLIIDADNTAITAVLWSAHSQNRDFRHSQWSAVPIVPATNGLTKQFKADVQYPIRGFVAFYAEIRFTGNGHSFLLSTQTTIQKSK